MENNGIYVREDLDRKLEWTREWEKECKHRKSKDMKLNAEGRVMVMWVNEMRWTIFNGCMKENEREGDWTYTVGRGESIKDWGVEGVRD